MNRVRSGPSESPGRRFEIRRQAGRIPAERMYDETGSCVEASAASGGAGPPDNPRCSSHRRRRTTV